MQLTIYIFLGLWILLSIVITLLACMLSARLSRHE